jgi:ribosome-associated translation inhibitor RaiA
VLVDKIESQVSKNKNRRSDRKDAVRGKVAFQNQANAPEVIEDEEIAQA